MIDGDVDGEATELSGCGRWRDRGGEDLICLLSSFFFMELGGGWLMVLERLCSCECWAVGLS